MLYEVITRRFNNNIDTMLTPRNFTRVHYFEFADFVTVDRKPVCGGFYVVMKFSTHGVIFEEKGHSLGVAHWIIDRDQFDVRVAPS